MSGLEKLIHNDQFNKDLLHWEETMFTIRRARKSKAFLRIEFSGYESKADYEAEADPLETASIVVKLNEPSGGDQFSSLRVAINARIADILADGLKLAKLTERFDEAIEK